MSSTTPPDDRHAGHGSPPSADDPAARRDRPADHAAPGDPADGEHAGDAADGHDGEPAGAVSASGLGRDRQSVLAREREEFGGMKIGSAFFGWLAATGTAVILTAVVAATGAVVGVTTGTTAEEAADQAATQTAGLAGWIVLVVLIFVAYFAGGYVAGRMARFDGAKQGLGVWLWAVVVAIAAAVVGLLAGADLSVVSEVTAFPRIPVDEGELTTAAVIGALAVALVSLGGAVLGGITGMRYHRRIDRVGLGS